MKTLEVYSFEGFLLSDRCLYTILKSGINNSIYNSTAYFYTFLDGIYTVMARTTKPLTTAEINNAKPKEKLYRLYDGNGLVLNITPSGSKAWYLQYKHPITSKGQMYKLGDYPILSLADARDRIKLSAMQWLLD